MKNFSGSSVRPASLRKAFLAALAIGVGFYSAVLSVAANASDAADTSAASAQTVLADGVYLFGQSPTPDEIGMTYAVFSVENNQTVGAFYQPHSSFDCFSGRVTPQNFDVTVVDSYTQTEHPYSIAMDLDSSLVAGSAVGGYTLDGFHQIEALSEQDLSILATCQAE